MSSPPSSPSARPLDGVRVLDLTRVLSGPHCTRMLRDLGAEVIKVEATSGDPIRSLPDPFEGASRGKRSVAVNLKADAVGPVLAELLRRADVVQHNFRPGAAERLGVDYESVRALRPDVVYGYAPGYGSTGPKSRLQSFAPLHSGFVGIAHESAGEGNEPGAAFGNEDYYNGQLNAVGMLLALVHQARTGEGQYVECAQLSSSIFATSHWYRRGGERHSVQPALDADQLGWDPHRRLYQCLEGWLCVFCVEADQEGALRAAVLGPEADAAASGEEMEYGFFARSAEEWVKELRPLGVPCAAVPEDYWLHTFLRDPAAIAAQRATPYEHDQHGAVSAIGRIVQLRGYPPCEPVRAPRLGEHTREVLAELGVPDADVEALIAAGAARTAD
jgi:crotonobetainyl-CoA:carnitine CoA-transferase CaiB-like acyl-CoA transferase